MGKKNKLNPEHKFTLYVKLSRRIPNSIVIGDSVRELYSDVSNVRKPRQKSSRWFLVDFDSNEKADTFKKLLQEKKEISGIRVKVNKMSLKENNPLSKPENERQHYVNSLTKQTFQSKSLEKYSNKLLVTNLPENVTASELAELFPNCLSLDLKHTPKLRAIVMYSSAKEAMAARLQVRPVFAGQKIRVILLLLEDGARKRKMSDSFEKAPSSASKNASSDVAKKDVNQPHKFIKPLRYFENDVQ